MFWYVVQLLVQLIIAFLLGLLVGWLLWARTLRKRTQLYSRETRTLHSEIGGLTERARTDVPAMAHAPAIVGDRNAIALQKAEGELVSLRRQVEALTTEHTSLAAAHAKLSDAHTKLSTTNARLQADGASLTDAHASLLAANERLQAEGVSLTHAHATLRAEHDALRDSVAAAPMAASAAASAAPLAFASTGSDGLAGTHSAADESDRGSAMPPDGGFATGAGVVGAAVVGSTAGALRDDLKRVEGIGPKMDSALRAVGIETFAQLAVAPLERLQSAIDAAKLRSPSVGTWSKQARFLADGDEAGFVAYVEHLVGGVEPDANGNR